MNLPMQIVFRNMPPSPAVEAKVRERVDKLDQMYDRIMSCRVVIEERHRRPHQDKLYHVCVDLHVPDRELAAKCEDQDVYLAVHDGFDAVCRRLQDYACRRRGDVKTHESPPGHPA